MRFFVVFLIVLLYAPVLALAGDVSGKAPDSLMTGRITPEEPESVEKVQLKTMKDNPDASGLPRDVTIFNQLPSTDDMPEGSNQVGNYHDPQEIGFNDPSAVVEEKEFQAGPKRIHIKKD